jgi:hypothetical protein
MTCTEIVVICYAIRTERLGTIRLEFQCAVHRVPSVFARTVAIVITVQSDLSWLLNCYAAEHRPLHTAGIGAC